MTRCVVDMAPLLAEAIASKRSLYNMIDAMYEKKPQVYQSMAMKSPWYHHDVIRSHGVIKEEYAMRVLGLFGVEEPQALLPILRAGWPSIVHYVETNNELSLADVVHTMPPSKNLSHQSSMDLITYPLIFIIAANLVGKQLKDDMALAAWGKLAAARLERRKQPNAATAKSRHQPRRLKKAKRSFYEHTGISRHFQSLKESQVPEVESVNTAIGSLLNSEGFSSILVDDYSLEDSDLDLIAELYFDNLADLFPHEGFLLFFVSAMYIKGTLKALKEAKDWYLKFKTRPDKERERLQQELAAKDVSIKAQEERIASLNEDNQRLSQRVESEYKRAVTEYQDKLRSLQRENERLSEEIESDKKELAGLRELFFELSKTEESSSESLQSDRLENVRGLIVGGHPRWQQRMKQTLPHFKFIAADDLSFDVGLFDDVEVVYFHPINSSHRLYYRVINEVRKRRIRIEYLSKTNEQACFREMVGKTARSAN